MRDLTTDAVLLDGLRAADTESTRAIIRNPEAFAFLVSNFNNTLKLASGNPVDVGIGLSKKALSTGKIVGKAGHSQGMVISVTVAQILVETASLVSVVGKGPTGAVMAKIGATFAKKTALTFSLAGGDDKKAKCIAALADLAASGLTTGALVATGVGTVFIAGSIAQLILSGYQSYEACYADGPGSVNPVPRR